MAELKTQPTNASVDDFIAEACGEGRSDDCRALVEMMSRLSGSHPVMWGPSIVGFGSYHYRYASGREGDWFEVGFSPRKRDLTLYIMSGFDGYEDLLARLGTFRTGVSCLYVKSLADIDLQVLEELVSASIAHVRAEMDTTHR
ncbi:DUF1801 domain-containing protein [Anaerosoma tenue]|uniref:DUF1801 domain-containing protein n=1 Tax=Anaerosoma tenue TaxID=2933588 RepID=UPI002260D1E1|nr:DUF1801 domain-containing protein [Anaerosoma tenue]MCK8113911.1 DUF1801 domain-containing protein [Anaerosoma tenue]